jgi:probable HAF family extracellular repeat protein
LIGADSFIDRLLRPATDCREILGELIPRGSKWVLTAVQAINQRGQIVGYGTVNQQTHAFLLTPHGASDRESDEAEDGVAE